MILIGFALEETVERSRDQAAAVRRLSAGRDRDHQHHSAPLSRLEWPTRTRALALISDLSLNVFLAMSLMSMQLWTLGGLGLALVVVLAAQTIAAVAYIVFAVFPAMGGNMRRP